MGGGGVLIIAKVFCPSTSDIPWFIGARLQRGRRQVSERTAVRVWGNHRYGWIWLYMSRTVDQNHLRMLRKQWHISEDGQCQLVNFSISPNIMFLSRPLIKIQYCGKTQYCAPLQNMCLEGITDQIHCMIIGMFLWHSLACMCAKLVKKPNSFPPSGTTLMPHTLVSRPALPIVLQILLANDRLHAITPETLQLLSWSVCWPLAQLPSSVCESTSCRAAT